MLVSRKKFSAMEFMSQTGAEIRIEEGMDVTIIMQDTEERIAGKVIKIATKELILHVEDESFDRLLTFSDFETIQVGIIPEEEEV